MACSWCEAPLADCECTIPKGRIVPFVQVGMIVHSDNCISCERVGSAPSWCEWLVCSLYEAGDEHMEAKLVLKNGTSVCVSCRDLRSGFRLAQPFDQSKTYTGKWRGSVAEECEDA